MDLGHCSLSNYDDDDDGEIGDLHIFFAFSDIFSCVLLQLMHYVDACCWVGLGWVGLGQECLHQLWVGSVT